MGSAELAFIQRKIKTSVLEERSLLVVSSLSSVPSTMLYATQERTGW